MRKHCTKCNHDLARKNFLIDYCSHELARINIPLLLSDCVVVNHASIHRPSKDAQGRVAVKRQDLPCTYLAIHELEGVGITIPHLCAVI